MVTAKRMDFKVIFKDTFVVDLEVIIKKVAIHNPDAALQLGEMIIRTAEGLSFFPERPSPGKAASGREAVCGEEAFQNFLPGGCLIANGGRPALLGWSP